MKETRHGVVFIRINLLSKKYVLNVKTNQQRTIYLIRKIYIDKHVHELVANYAPVFSSSKCRKQSTLKLQNACCLCVDYT